MLLVIIRASLRDGRYATPSCCAQAIFQELFASITSGLNVWYKGGRYFVKCSDQPFGSLNVILVSLSRTFTHGPICPAAAFFPMRYGLKLVVQCEQRRSERGELRFQKYSLKMASGPGARFSRPPQTCLPRSSRFWKGLSPVRGGKQRFFSAGSCAF